MAESRLRLCRSGSSAAETSLVWVTARNVGRARHCGTSLIGLPVSFHHLSFEGPVRGWSRVSATGQKARFDLSAERGRLRESDELVITFRSSDQSAQITDAVTMTFGI
jgi:hypothetical protein